MYEYAARLVRVIDADTMTFHIDTGFRIWLHDQRIRVYGINAPEMSTDAGKAAKSWAEAWFTTHCPDDRLTIRTIKDSHDVDKADSFGRYLGVLVAPDGAVFADDALAAGQAVEYVP